MHKWRTLGQLITCLVVTVAVTVVLVLGVGAKSPVQKAAEAVAQPAVSPADISDGRFTRTVSLDGGALTIRPAPSNAEPGIGQAEAQALVGTYSQSLTPFGCSTSGPRCLIGFGEVSINPHLLSGASEQATWVGIRIISTGSIGCLPVDYQGSTYRGPSPPWLYQVSVVDGSGAEVVHYTSRASTCGKAPRGPYVSRVAAR